MQHLLELDELLNTAIVGPWIVHGHRIGDPPTPAVPQSTWRDQFIYPTLTHWIEASKVLSSRKDLMEAIIFSPSVKEAKRLTRLNKSACRNDWNLISHAVFSCALSTLSLQRPQFDLVNADLSEIAKSLLGTGLSSNFISTCLLRFDQWRKGPKVCFIGADLAPEETVGKKVSKTVASVGTWTLVSTNNGRTSWQLHDWALAHYIPIQYVGTPTERMGRSLYHSLIDASTQVVVFEKRGDRRHDAPLRKAKELGRKLTLELYDVQPDHSNLL